MSRDSLRHLNRRDRVRVRLAMRRACVLVGKAFGEAKARIQHARNAGWALVENLIHPALMLLTTPILLGALGDEEFGLNALAIAILALTGPASLGLGTATVKFVSANRGAENPEEVVRVVQRTLALSIVCGSLVLFAVLASAHSLTRIFFVAMGDPVRVALALQLAGAMVAISQVDMVFSAALRGCERFDITARLEVSLKLTGTAMTVGLALAFQDTLIVLGGGVMLSMFACVLRGYIVSKVLGTGIWRPTFRGALDQNLLQFAGWSWLQSNAGAIFQIFDRLIVGSAIGAATLASYTICTQLGQQVHALPAAALAILFPLISRKMGANQMDSVRRIENVGVLAALGVIVPIGLGLILLREPILTVWLGAEFASNNGELFAWVVIAYSVLALSVAPHFLLMGRGDIRFLSLLGISGGLVSLVAMLLLVGPYGVLGVVWARMAYGTVNLCAFLRLLHLRRREYV